MEGRLADLFDKLEAIQEPQTSQGYYELYVPSGAKSLNENMRVAVIFTPEFVDDDWLPEYAREHNLEPIYEVTLLQSVLRVARDDKPDASVNELVAALDYFQKNDSYMDLKNPSG